MKIKATITHEINADTKEEAIDIMTAEIMAMLTDGFTTLDEFAEITVIEKEHKFTAADAHHALTGE